MYFYLKGKYSEHKAIVDEVDADLVSRGFTGQYAKSYNPPQIVPILPHKKGKKRTLYLGRIILERKLGRPLEKGEMAEHRNRNTLDNRRLNLRTANNSQNQANRSAMKCSTSGYKGVCWHKGDSKWRAQICKNRKVKYLGVYSNEIEAARAYDEAAKELFGEFALLNFSG